MESKEITNNTDSKEIGLSYNTNEVITYKEDNGIVYGYLNQKALDCVIYNRAKQNTQDFAILEESDDGEEPTRALKLDDISIQRHCIVFRPLSEGEYVEKGGFILDLGLYYLSSYCRENNTYAILLVEEENNDIVSFVLAHDFEYNLDILFFIVDKNYQPFY